MAWRGSISSMRRRARRKSRSTFISLLLLGVSLHVPPHHSRGSLVTARPHDDLFTSSPRHQSEIERVDQAAITACHAVVGPGRANPLVRLRFGVASHGT